MLPKMYFYFHWSLCLLSSKISIWRTNDPAVVRFIFGWQLWECHRFIFTIPTISSWLHFSLLLDYLQGFWYSLSFSLFSVYDSRRPMIWDSVSGSLFKQSLCLRYQLIQFNSAEFRIPVRIKEQQNTSQKVLLKSQHKINNNNLIIIHYIVNALLLLF